MYRQIFSILAVAATATAVTHEITVGAKGALRFDPAEITAAVGDTLEFRFFSPSGPHNVASGDFSTPCTPNANAFFSGDMDGDDNGDALFIVEVKTTDPIYFYCAEARHCQNGMVGAVNAPSSAGLAAYKSAAQKVAKAEEPAGVTGGTVTTKSSDDSSSSAASSSATTGGSSTGASQASASTSASASASTTGAATKSSSASNAASVTSSASAAGQTSAAAGSASASKTAPTTNNVAAGRISQGTVLGGLAALLGGFVALMA